MLEPRLLSLALYGTIRTAWSSNSPLMSTTTKRSTPDRQADATETLKRWLAGDHSSNNNYR